MTVLIPAYDPTERLISLVKELKEKTDYQVVIVNDGSNLTCTVIFEQIEDLGCTVLTHTENQGKGAALKTGFSYIADEKREKEGIICADADGQHTAFDILCLAKALEDGKSEMLLGVRKFEGKIPIKSRVGNILATLFFQMATDILLCDTQTGLRGYPMSLIPWLMSVKGSRFEYELNVLLESKNNHMTIKQIPIETIYENRNKGTHFRPIWDSFRIMAPMFKFCGSSISAGVLDFILFCLLQCVMKNLFWCVAIARVISSIYNYMMNKNMVFGAKDLPVKKTAMKYFGLVTIIMGINYSLIFLMSSALKMPTITAKLLTEILLFMLNYTVQKAIVFSKGEKKISPLHSEEEKNPLR